MFKAKIKSKQDEDICILIKVENHSFNYICDCGEATGLSVKECQNTKAIFISHTHIDHFVNFDTILRHQIGTGRKVIICGPKGIINQVQNRIKSYCWNLIEKDAISYEIREIQEHGTIKTATINPPFWEQEEKGEITGSKIFEEKDFCVEFEILDHKTDSISYLFKANDKIKIALDNNFKGGKWVADLKKSFEMNTEDVMIDVHGVNHLSKDLFYMVKKEEGEKLGVIMDHAANAENHKKIKNRFFKCDHVFIECFYKDEDKQFASSNYHSYASMSGQIMKACEVKKAIPVHFSRKYGTEEIEELLIQFEKAKNN
ncbi:peptidase [Formosa sp. L2A11]|uniref:peptidase n=1 Tax=Formosa sp. L2A11 TaxID=2686363 RepID=UPI00131B893D|nr:peptidase [Formosa sp. L2A11]